MMARMGADLLSHAGLSELVVETEEAYAEVAVALAEDPDRLRRLRSGLRTRVQASPLMDAAKFAANFAEAMRGMWRHWCKQQKKEA